jgi:hypothetical protein
MHQTDNEIEISIYCETMNTFKIFLMDTPELGVVVFMLVAVLTTLICYGVTRILLISRIGEDSELLARGVLTRVGALHALILALMFAQEMADYRDISRIVSKEASAISDVYNGLREYDEENQQSTAAIRGLVVDYVKAVSQADRTALAESQISHRTWTNYHRINRQLRDLQPGDDNQKDLRALMLKDWDAVSEFHLRLGAIAEYEAPGFFWVVIISGFLVVVILCYVYSPNIANLAMLGTYAAFNGLIMYVIFSIANPFTGALAIDPNILESLLAMMGSTTP